MKKVICTLAIALVAVATIMTTSCKKEYEEFYFKGTVIGGELCGSPESPQGYMMVIEKPTDIGDTITYMGRFYENVIMGYGKNTRSLTDGEVVYGVAYIFKNYAAMNCSGVFQYKLPEMVMLSVDEDPSHLE